MIDDSVRPKDRKRRTPDVKGTGKADKRQSKMSKILQRVERNLN